MKTFPSDLLQLKNELHSTGVWAWLLRLQYRTEFDPVDIFGVEYVTSYNEPITFDSQIFYPYPFKIGTIEDNSAGEIRRVTISAANIDQRLTARLEQYWASVLDPLWIVTVWLVNSENPALTPINTNDNFVVTQATMDFLNVTFECKWEGLALRKLVPRRRYAHTGGFLYIPRKVR